MEGDDRTFRADFTSEGVGMLRDQVKEKLKELIGEYSDDMLVEYVIILLKSGRRKDEAKSELDAFLGDDSESFITWLWNHLGAHLSLYMQPRESYRDGAPKTIDAAGELAVRAESYEIESEAEKGNSRKNYVNCHNGGVEVEVLPPQTPADHRNVQDVSHRRVGHTKQSLSPLSKIWKKRKRSEERQLRKGKVSQRTVSAPRRLLQFAVRDAVATSTPSNTFAQPSFKCPRSVSLSTGHSFLEKRPERIRRVAGLRTVTSPAFKSAAEAAQDVSKARPSCSVFCRLGCGFDVSNTTNNRDNSRVITEDGVTGDVIEGMEDIHLAYHRQNNRNMLQEETTLMASGPGYDGANTTGRGALHKSQSGSSGGNWEEDYLICPSIEADDLDEASQGPHKDLLQPGTAYIMFSETAPFVSMKTLETRCQGVREITSLMPRAEIAPASPFTVPKIGRALLSRGVTSLYRTRILTKPSPRSFVVTRSTVGIVPPPTRCLRYAFGRKPRQM